MPKYTESLYMSCMYRFYFKLPNNIGLANELRVVDQQLGSD